MPSANAGKVDSEDLVTIPVLKEWVMTAQHGRNKIQYVFTGAFSNKVRKLSVETFGNLKMYQRFAQSVTRNLYNTTEIYGMKAINIDQPQESIVSVRLKFVIVNEDSPCVYREIKSKM